MADPGNIDSPPTTPPHCKTPVIIGPSNHPITVEMIDRDAFHVLRRLNKAGFSGYLVGGGVRDLYLGKTPKDFDISTDARPGQIRKLFPNSTTIGKRFRLVQVFFPQGKLIEISTLRSLSEHDLDGPEVVLAPNNTFGSLDEDAQRRDLTINSLFFEIEHCTIIDYVNGVQDLDNAIIRIVGDPDKRIHRDPVRMMRAIRHSARNTFTIEKDSWTAICANAQKLSLCPTSRLRDELLKDLYSGAAASWFQLAVDSGIFFCLFHIYKEILFQPQPGGSPYKDQLAGILAVIDRLILFLDKQKKTKPTPSFILALILIPWADAKYGLCHLQLKGHAIFHFSKKIREDLDTHIGLQLNLRRSLRQEMAMLLTNLPIFIQYHQEGKWPKWLRKKSYFKDSSLFFHVYMEAMTKQPMPDLLVDHFKGPQTWETPAHADEKFAHRKTKPAFSKKHHGGIFGLKKKS
jgi:poly(A) polymerase